jgi:hypothetical protein
MNRHLSSEQFSWWMAGEHTAAEEQHTEECLACGAELARMEQALSLFRDSARDWAWQNGSEARDVWSAREAGHGFGVQALQWMAAALIVFLLVAIPMQMSKKNRQPEAGAAQIDTALLEQVDTEVSRAVPATMEPLATLVPGAAVMAEEAGSPQISKQKTEETQ